MDGRGTATTSRAARRARRPAGAQIQYASTRTLWSQSTQKLWWSREICDSRLSPAHTRPRERSPRRASIRSSRVHASPPRPSRVATADSGDSPKAKTEKAQKETTHFSTSEPQTRIRIAQQHIHHVHGPCTIPCTCSAHVTRAPSRRRRLSARARVVALAKHGPTASQPWRGALVSRNAPHTHPSQRLIVHQRGRQQERACRAPSKHAPHASRSRRSLPARGARSRDARLLRATAGGPTAAHLPPEGRSIPVRHGRASWWGAHRRGQALRR